MSLGIDYPVTSTGNVYTSIDPYNAALLNNGASVNLGTIYAAPLNPAKVGAALNGSGLQNFFKYVRYNPTVSQAILSGPAPVYWKDETFTTVTGLYTEAVFQGANAFAGWLAYNTTTLSTATAAQINGNFCFIITGGFIPGAISVAATAAGDALFAAATGAAFLVGRTAAGTAPANRVAGWALTAVAGGLSDIYVPFTN